MSSRIFRTTLITLVLALGLMVFATSAFAQSGDTPIELVGTVEAISPSSITVNGLTLQTTGAEIKIALTLQLVVKVEAVVQADGTLRAVEIDEPGPGDLLPGEIELVGRLQTMTATQAQVFGLDIDLTGAEVQAGLTLGELVRVHARFANGQWVAREIAPFGPVAATGSGLSTDDELEFTGTLESVGQGFMLVSGQQIDVGGAEIKAGLMVGAMVKVHFALVNGQMVAREVEPVFDTLRIQDRDQTQDQDRLQDGSAAVSIPAGCVVTPPQNWVRYTLRFGDTLSGLAFNTGASLRDLLEVNCIRNPRGLLVGAEIFVPRQPVGNTGAGSIDDHGSNSGNDSLDDHGNNSVDDHGGNSHGDDSVDDHGGNSHGNDD